MQIAAYNAHLGLLRSELLLRVEAATVYPDRLRGRLRYLIREYHHLSQPEIRSGIEIYRSLSWFGRGVDDHTL